MIFILNPNPTSSSFEENWSFNMVSELGLVGSSGFEPPLYNLFAICRFKSSWRTLFGLFDSLHAGMGLHVREGVKGMIFILNPNPTSSCF